GVARLPGQVQQARLVGRFEVGGPLPAVLTGAAFTEVRLGRVLVVLAGQLLEGLLARVFFLHRRLFRGRLCPRRAFLGGQEGGQGDSEGRGGEETRRGEPGRGQATVRPKGV